MSRIGRLPIELPKGVSANIDDATTHCSEGTERRAFQNFMSQSRLQ